MSKATVRFEVLDLHPGRGHKRALVHEEEIVCEEMHGIFPGAGKHYSDLMKKFNGCSSFSWSNPRYEVRFYRVNP